MRSRIARGDEDVDAKRSRPSIGKPAKCHARKERAEVIGTDQWITSGPAARTAAFRGRIHGCTRIVSRKRQILFPCTAGAVHTWHHPEMPERPDYFRLLTCCGLRADLPAGKSHPTTPSMKNNAAPTITSATSERDISATKLVRLSFDKVPHLNTDQTR